MTSGDDLRLLELLPGDLDWVAALERQLHHHPWTEGNFRDALASGYACMKVRRACADIGYLVVMYILDEAHLLNISIDRQMQGQGVGKRVLELVFSLAREQGANCMFLEVRPSNAPALALYRKLDFEEIGRRRNYYPAPNGREDAIVMRRVL